MMPDDLVRVGPARDRFSEQLDQQLRLQICVKRHGKRRVNLRMWNKLFVHQVSLSCFKKFPLWARDLNTNSVYVQEPQTRWSWEMQVLLYFLGGLNHP
jgi:hypothetical protein